MAAGIGGHALDSGGTNREEGARGRVADEFWRGVAIIGDGNPIHDQLAVVAGAHDDVVRASEARRLCIDDYCDGKFAAGNASGAVCGDALHDGIPRREECTGGLGATHGDDSVA